jgi:hypothetical protein
MIIKTKDFILRHIELKDAKLYLIVSKIKRQKKVLCLFLKPLLRQKRRLRKNF